MSKPDLRELILSRRVGLSESTVSEKSERVFANFLGLSLDWHAKKISVYIPAKGEVDTKKIIERLGEEATIFLPKFANGAYKLSEFYSGKNLEEGPFGILQPVGNKYISPTEIDIAIFPGVAFDRHGVRLGYGKGVFDRLFAKSKAVRIGLAYDFQIVDRLPKEKHDLSMDYVVSEKRVLSF